MVLGMKAGLDPQMIFDLVQAGAGNSRVFELRAPMMVKGNYKDATMKIDGREVDVRGVDDPHISRDRYEEVAGPFDVQADLRLGITHAPYLRVLDGMSQDGAQLILAGHTHGGQLCVPGVGALVTNCDLPRQQAKGVSAYDGSTLHVSAGLGNSPYAPVRFACRPEASLLTLTPATD